MLYQLVHDTTYEYTGVAEACHNLARLTPRKLPHQQPLRWQLQVDPVPMAQHAYDDFFGNRVHSFAIYEPHERLAISATSLVRVASREHVNRQASLPWREVSRRLRVCREPETIDALQYVFDSVFVRGLPELRSYAQSSFTAERPVMVAVEELNTRIHREFTYDPKATTIGTSVVEVLDRRRGVCQDFAHLAIGCLRSLGLACRYVSGYLCTNPRPDARRLEGADASHAWISAYCPNLGWIDFDPTNGCLADDRYITLGWGRDFHDLSPVKGIVLGGGASTLQVAVSVLPLANGHQQQQQQQQ
ncbi:MAG: transglutaminase family protein [Pirellulales bacterium]|nr:transglutaminase family protein [Pirellulales bacterium]